MKDVRQLFEIIHSDENKDNFKNRGNDIIEAKNNFISHLKFQELFPEAQKGR